MRDRIEQALKGHNARYVEVHLEQNEGTSLVYRGKSLEEVTRSSGVGGNVRALDKGGWGFASFNDVSELRDKVAIAVSHARGVGGERIDISKRRASLRCGIPFHRRGPSPRLACGEEEPSWTAT